MKYVELTLLGCLVIASSAVAIAQINQTAQEQNSATAARRQAKHEDRGQQVFNENCSRCHNAPEGFSPNISGSVARHMRVRANLSDADYKALLRFLNP
jgi:cytochrome c5